MKKVCIFDLDGTLVDTLDSLTVSVNDTLEELGFSKITRKQCRAFIGNGARNLMQQSILNSQEACGTELLDRAMVIYGRVFAQKCMYQVVPYDGIREVLHALKEQGVVLAILSNKPHERTVEIAEQYFGVGYFDHIQGQCDTLPRKPDPESLYYVMRLLGAQKEQCIYIGDSEVDMITGEGAGITTIGVSWGFRDRIILENKNAAAIIDEPIELLKCIGQ